MNAFRSSTPADRDRARRRVRTFSGISALGALAATGALTLVLVPSPHLTASPTSTTITTPSTTDDNSSATASSSSDRAPVATSGGS